MNVSVSHWNYSFASDILSLNVQCAVLYADITCSFVYANFFRYPQFLTNINRNSNTDTCQMLDPYPLIFIARNFS